MRRLAYYEKGTLVAPTGESLKDGFQVEKADCVQVRDIMTPVVFAVNPETSARKVVEDMLSLKVHRLFVVGSDGWSASSAPWTCSSTFARNSHQLLPRCRQRLRALLAPWLRAVVRLRPREGEP